MTIKEKMKVKNDERHFSPPKLNIQKSLLKERKFDMKRNPVSRTSDKLYFLNNIAYQIPPCRIKFS